MAMVPTTPPPRKRKASHPASPLQPGKRWHADISLSDEDGDDRKPSLAYLPSPSSSPLARKSVIAQDKKPKLEPPADLKPKRERTPSAKARAAAAAHAEQGEASAESEADENEEGDSNPAFAVEVAGLEQWRIAPSPVQGMEVRWDRQVKTINTTKAKKLYKLNDNYLYALDRESTTGSLGYPMYLYSEHRVQQAAYDMQGGKAYFDAYVQRLHATKAIKAANRGLPTLAPLSPTKPPLAPVAYVKKRTAKSWTDQTQRA